MAALMVDLIRSNGCAEEFLKKIILLIGQPAGGNASNGIRPVFLSDCFEVVSDETERFIPRRFSERAIHS
jgi:hypothetical protein